MDRRDFQQVVHLLLRQRDIERIVFNGTDCVEPLVQIEKEPCAW